MKNSIFIKLNSLKNDSEPISSPRIITDQTVNRPRISRGFEGVIFEKDNTTFKPALKGPKQALFWTAAAPVYLPYWIVSESS